MKKSTDFVYYTTDTYNKTSSQINPSNEAKVKGWKRFLNKINENPIFNIIVISVGFLSFIFTIWSLIATLTTREVEVKEIRLGLAPFQINEISDLEDNYLLLLKNSNIFLRDQESGYRLSPFISNSGGYEGVLDDLKNNKIQIAFVTQYLYTILKNNKLCKFKWSDNNKDFELIGFKKQKNNCIYNSGIVYNIKDSAFIKRVLTENPLDTFKINEFKDRITIILNADEFSTSSHVLPEIFLLEKGINLKRNKIHELLSRSDMKKKVKENQLNIGFISNEDYERIEPKERAKLCFWNINIPIPYDAILVNYKWWKRLSNTEREVFKRALNTYPMGFIENNCIKKEYDVFYNYLSSGVVYKAKGGNGYVQFPDKQFDIFNFDTIKKVKLVRFEVGNMSSRALFSLKQIELGNAILNYSNGEYQIVSDKLKQGAHVLPKWAE